MDVPIRLRKVGRIEGGAWLMRRPERRPLQIADILILIVASAFAIVLIKRQGDDQIGDNLMGLPAWPLWTQMLLVFGSLGPYVGTAAAVALLAIRLRGPRPPRPRLTRQPGPAACAAVTLMIALHSVFHLARVMVTGVDNPFRSGFSYETLLVLLDGVRWSFLYNGPAVAAAWLTLAIGGRWRPAPDWVDRSGRTAGLFWLLMLALNAWYIPWWR